MMLLKSLKKLVCGHSLASVPTPAAQGGPYDGFIEALSRVHAQGWIRDLSDPERRVDFEIALADTGEILASGRADRFGLGLAAAGVGDGTYAFWTRFARPVSAAEHDRLTVRVTHSQTLIASDRAIPAFEPLLHVAMDIVDNCNLRCPFCVYDYAQTRATHFMTDETLEAALRFLPYAKDGEFWFSCLHEPSLHPRLIEFIDRVPRDYRRKLFYTTNLAKRMTPDYFAWLAGNGMHHINISIESRTPAIYEKMRKGARFDIFMQNWDRLIEALDQAESPTPIRYIAMAYKSNLHELPDLARTLLDERHAVRVEIRNTFDVPWIPADFRASEFLDDEDWTWLEAALSHLPSDKVQLFRPPPKVQAPSPAVPALTTAPVSTELLPGHVMLRLSWDGTAKVIGVRADSRYDSVLEKTIYEINIRDIADPEEFFESLPATVTA